MNRRHWLYAIAATIGAAFLPKSKAAGPFYVAYGSGRFGELRRDMLGQWSATFIDEPPPCFRKKVTHSPSDLERVRAYIDERLPFMRDK